MNIKPKKLNWLWGDGKEEDFWSMLKDERERKLWLYQLYQERSGRRWLMILFTIALLIEIGAKLNSLPIFIFLLFMFGILYIDTESKIRIIRLYELLSVKDKAINENDN